MNILPDKVPDRAKMRRAYVWKKGGVYSVVGITGTVSFAGCVFTVFVVLVFLLSHFYGNCDEESCLTDWQLFLSYLPGIVAGIAAGCTGYYICGKAKKVAANIPYVPPVRTQLPTLPANEVLLRGSQASPASPEELLRSAGINETPEDELLRAASGGKAE